MKVAVIGTGYVGLVTGACLSNLGHSVTCVDNNAEKVATMKGGISPIYEPGLETVMSFGMSRDQLNFTTDLKTAVREAEIIFIAVGTPSLASGETDTRFVEMVAREIGEGLKGSTDYKVVINKSTVPIGSGDWVRKLIGYEHLDIVSNPEFLREGTAVGDTFHPDRVVLGGSSKRALDLVKALYQPLTHNRYAEQVVPVVETDITSAEMIKYAANAFLATKISFINEMANICERVGGDVTEVARGIGLDSRIGAKFLQAGIGWGGSCFPKDVSALIHTADDYGYDASLLKAAVAVNVYQGEHLVELLQRKLRVIKGKTIGVMGLTFKPDTDDTRDAPSFKLIKALTKLGASIKTYDPLIQAPTHDMPVSNVEYCNSVSDMRSECDGVVLVTDWKEFHDLDYALLYEGMSGRLFIDGRNMLKAETMRSIGFDYYGIGRDSL